MVVVVLAVLPIQMWKNLLLLLLSEKRITGIHLPERSPNPEDQPRLPIRTHTHARTHTHRTRNWCWCLNFFCFFVFFFATLCSFVNAHSSSLPLEAGLNFFFRFFASLVCSALHFQFCTSSSCSSSPSVAVVGENPDSRDSRTKKKRFHFATKNAD